MLSQSTIYAEQEKQRICIKLWATVWGLKSIELSNIPYIGQMEIDCVTVSRDYNYYNYVTKKTFVLIPTTYVDVHLSYISILLDYVDKWCLTRESS